MATRILVALITLVAVVEGLAAGAIGGYLPLILVILGLVYGAMGVDAGTPPPTWWSPSPSEERRA